MYTLLQRQQAYCYASVSTHQLSPAAHGVTSTAALVSSSAVPSYAAVCAAVEAMVHSITCSLKLLLYTVCCSSDQSHLRFVHINTAMCARAVHELPILIVSACTKYTLQCVGDYVVVITLSFSLEVSAALACSTSSVTTCQHCKCMITCASADTTLRSVSCLNYHAVTVHFCPPTRK
jgi:hypothetical protein